MMTHIDIHVWNCQVFPSFILTHMHLHIYSHMDEVQNLMSGLSGLLQCFHAITRAAAGRQVSEVLYRSSSSAWAPVVQWHSVP